MRENEKTPLGEKLYGNLVPLFHPKKTMENQIDSPEQGGTSGTRFFGWSEIDQQNVDFDRVIWCGQGEGEIAMIIYADNSNTPYDQQRTWLIDDTVMTHEDNVYHLVEIEDDRYSGIYSGHRFTAWPGVRPSDVDAGDIGCENFWDRWRDKAVYGGGTTAQEAFHDLIQKMERLGINIVDSDDPEGSNLLVVILHSCMTQPKAMLYDSTEFRAWLVEKESR